MRSRLALLAGSLLVALLLLELGARLWRGPAALFDWHNIVLQDRRATIAVGASRLVHDQRLGFAARPGFSQDGVSYDANGYRRAPAPAGATLTEPPLLLVGDSFTHGDELNDADAWPTRLQALLGRRVLNGALSGYALDQIVLSAEFRAAGSKPAGIVAVFVADDLRRSEMKRVWGAEKPYFQPVGGKLELRNVPVPPRPDPADTLDIWQRLFGWSVALDTVLRARGWQYEWAVDHERVLPRGSAEGFACALVERLRTSGVPVLLVAGYDPFNWKNEEYSREQRRISAVVLRCGEAAGFATLDLFETLDASVKARGYAATFMAMHPSPTGAEAIARRVATEVGRLGLK